MNGKTITLIYRAPWGSIVTVTKTALSVPGQPGLFEAIFRSTGPGATVLGTIFSDPDYGFLSMTPCETLISLSEGDEYCARVRMELKR